MKKATKKATKKTNPTRFFAPSRSSYRVDGRRLVAHLTEAGLTQAYLARRLKMSTQQLNAVVRGRSACGEKMKARLVTALERYVK